jgi:hypothetical protein
MTRGLRQRHRHAVLALAVFLPVALIGGLAARKSVPVNPEVSAALAGKIPQFDAVEKDVPQLFPKLSLAARFLREKKDAGGYAVEFFPAKDFIQPDLLVYWAPDSPKVGGELPTNAVFIATFGSRPMALPPELTSVDGAFVLYSLANKQVVDASAPMIVGTTVK